MSRFANLARPLRLLPALVASILTHPALAAPEVPGVAPPHPVALVGGTIHPVSGPPIEGGTLLMHQGKIVAVGTDVPLPNGTEEIDVAGRHVYPGMIAAYTSLGLSEIDSVRATIDQTETGTVNPNVRAQVAFNPDSELIPVARSNGVLSALTAPRGGLVSGTSAVMQLDGWTWEEMCLRPAAGMHVEWPRYGAREDWLSGTVEPADAGARDAAMKSIRQTLADARAYQAARQSLALPGTAEPAFDARWEAMLPVLSGQVPLVVAADEAPQIESAVALAAAEGLKVIIRGGYEAPLCAELLLRHDVPVIVSATHRLPLRSSDAYDDPFTVPLRLHQAGVRFCIATDEDAWNVRNLPYQAATAAAYGLPPDVALAAVTLYPAQILGVADRLGSLEAGKDATLFVCDGDPLEVATHVTAAYIGGRPVDLSDRHKRLWEKYKEKYRRLGIENP